MMDNSSNSSEIMTEAGTSSESMPGAGNQTFLDTSEIKTEPGTSSESMPGAANQTFLDTSEIKTEPGTSSESMSGAANQTFLDTFMADFQSVEGASLWSSVGGKSTLLGDWPLKDFSKCAASMLCSDYKVEDKDILFTTAFALSAGVPDSAFLTAGVADVSTSMARMLPFKQFFTGEVEEEEEELSAKAKAKALCEFRQLVDAHADNLDTKANAALQAFLLVTAMNLTGKKPPGSSVKLASRKSNNLSYADTKKKLLLISTMAKVLHKKSSKFEDEKLSAQLANIHKDLQIVADL